MPESNLLARIRKVKAMLANLQEVTAGIDGPAAKRVLQQAEDLERELDELLRSLRERDGG